MSFRVLVSVALLSTLVAHVASAQQIPLPTAEYQVKTTKLPIPYPPAGATVTSVSGGGYTVNFQTVTGTAESLQVWFVDPSADPNLPSPPAPPYNWGTWSRPPYSEYTGQGTLPVGWTQGATFLRFAPTTPVGIFGFEAEPDDRTASYAMTATFYFQSVVVGTVTQLVNGDGGARLFAYQAPQIDRVDFASTVDFAIANVRVAATGVTLTPTAAVPEPATLALVGIGLTGVGATAMRRRAPRA